MLNTVRFKISGECRRTFSANVRYEIEGECKSILQLVLDIYKQFGFEEVAIKLSTRPEKRMGSDADWDRLENALSASLEAQGLQWSVNPGEGAFYVPKLEFVLRHKEEKIL